MKELDEQRIKDDIKRYENETGHEFRTAHLEGEKAGFYDHTVTSADVL